MRCTSFKIQWIFLYKKVALETTHIDPTSQKISPWVSSKKGPGKMGLWGDSFLRESCCEWFNGFGVKIDLPNHKRDEFFSFYFIRVSNWNRIITLPPSFSSLQNLPINLLQIPLMFQLWIAFDSVNFCYIHIYMKPVGSVCCLLVCGFRGWPLCIAEPTRELTSGSLPNCPHSRQ